VQKPDRVASSNMFFMICPLLRFHGDYFAGAESSKDFVRSEPAANREGHWTGAI